MENKKSKLNRVKSAIEPCFYALSEFYRTAIIKYERWAELFAEGQWWYDVRRWEILENEMKVYKTTRYGTLVYQERAYAQPIPLTEIERYNGGLVQNYNY